VQRQGGWFRRDPDEHVVIPRLASQIGRVQLWHALPRVGSALNDRGPFVDTRGRDDVAGPIELAHGELESGTIEVMCDREVRRTRMMDADPPCATSKPNRRHGAARGIEAPQRVVLNPAERGNDDAPVWTDDHARTPLILAFRVSFVS